MRVLIRQGAGPLEAYQQALEQHIAQERRIHQAITQSTGDDQPTPPDRTAPTHYGLGDADQLRGIPAVGGVGSKGGAIQGTRPTDALRGMP